MALEQFLYHSLMHRCEGEFPSFCSGLIEGMAKEKRWTAMLLCRKDEFTHKVLVDLNLFVSSTYIIPAPTRHPESVYISIHNELYMSWKE